MDSSYKGRRVPYRVPKGPRMYEENYNRAADAFEDAVVASVDARQESDDG